MDPRTDLSKVAGSDSMAAPSSSSSRVSYAAAAGSNAPSSSRTQHHAQSHNAAANARLQGADVAPAKKKRHRAGKKRRNRRQSFIAPSEDTNTEIERDERPSLLEVNRPSATQTSFYRLKSAARSNTSLESEALLDHREQQPIRTRRQSIKESMFASRGGSTPFSSRQSAHRAGRSNSLLASSPIKSRAMRPRRMSDSDDDNEEAITDRTPLMSNAHRDRDRPSTNRTNSSHKNNYGTRRKASPMSMNSSRRGKMESGLRYSSSEDEDFDVNNPLLCLDRPRWARWTMS
ncbi:hypothetical protein AAFC00_005348 [Neodothiora populina]|uniref:Uncharacterized protein n=1 Tax=Neodothiora populina TaxID=2781224 RepID=A0ABR3PKM3_9PEZI